MGEPGSGYQKYSVKIHKLTKSMHSILFKSSKVVVGIS